MTTSAADRVEPEAGAGFASLFKMIRHPLLVLDEQLRFVRANRTYYDTFRLRPRQIEGELLYEISEGVWNCAELRQLLEEVLPQRKDFDSFRVERDFPNLGPRTFLLNARRLKRATGEPGRILLVLEDVANR